MTSSKGEKILLSVGRDAAQDLYRRQVISFLLVWTEDQEFKNSEGVVAEGRKGGGGRRAESQPASAPLKSAQDAPGCPP